MARIALISDMHLGTRQYGLKERYDDFMDSFLRFARKVSARKDVDAVVMGGDLFDSSHPDARAVLAAQSAVRMIKDSGKRVLGIDGNHDLAGGGWLKAIGAEAFEDGGVAYFDNVSIRGVNYRNGRDLVEFLNSMVDSGMKADILVAHFALAEMNGGGSADTGVQELSPILDRLGVKAVLMGHVHIPDCRRWNGVLYVNPGSTEMKSVNEPKDKYYFVLDTNTWEAEPCQLETRRVVQVEVEDEEGLLRLQERMTREAKDRADGREDVESAPFYQIIADDSVTDVFDRLSGTVHDTGSISRIVIRSSKARDVAPVVDRSESVSTLEGAIEARFPADSAEAKLIKSLLHSPEPSAIHLIVSRFMEGEKPE